MKVEAEKAGGPRCHCRADAERSAAPESWPSPAVRRHPGKLARRPRREAAAGAWGVTAPGSCGGAQGVSRERGRQMSRGPAQHRRWRREVRASGRSLPGPWRPHLGRGAALRWKGSGRGCRIAEAGTTFWTRRAGWGWGRKRELSERRQAQSVDFTERRTESGKRGK